MASGDPLQLKMMKLEMSRDLGRKWSGRGKSALTNCIYVRHFLLRIRLGLKFDNNIESQIDATITNIIDNFNQLNMFRTIISPVFRSIRLCLKLVL